MNCPKCGSPLRVKNEDGDYECLCGYIMYQKVAEPEEAKPKIKQKPESTPLENYEPGITREGFLKILTVATQPIVKVDDNKIRAELPFALLLLKNDVIKSFRDEYKSKIDQYGEDVAFDAYIETLVERNDLRNIIKMLKQWSKYLNTLKSWTGLIGAQYVMNTLISLCIEIDKMRPEEGEG